MTHKATELVSINSELRLILFGIDCAFDVSLSPSEIERVFADADRDQVSPKQYEFWNDRRLTVRGEVGDYEPETIWILMSGRGASQEKLNRIIELAKYAWHRWSLNSVARLCAM